MEKIKMIDFNCKSLIILPHLDDEFALTPLLNEISKKKKITNFQIIYCCERINSSSKKQKRRRKDNLKSQDGYFLGGRSLTGVVIAGSMLLTNLSTEHLVGLNGSSYKNGMIVIAWEVTSALALVFAALFFIPKYLSMGLTTIPEYLEKRFNNSTRTIVALFLMISFVLTLLPIVLYTGAINLESIFDISKLLNISKDQGLTLTVWVIGIFGSSWCCVFFFYFLKFITDYF